MSLPSSQPNHTSPSMSKNPHASPRVGPVSMLTGLWQHRRLTAQMIRREVLGRYRGSAMGLAWSFFQPLFMLAVYTFVFSVVFKARWGTGEGVVESKTQFAMLLFAGLIVLNLFTEVINRAPLLVIANVNFVKKVVFPLEILPLQIVGAALFHCCINSMVLLAAVMIFNGGLHWTLIFFPLVLLPLVILVLGFAWILASLGVYLRDVGQTIGLVSTVLTFVSPVFYPLSAMPARFRPFIMANPLTFIIEQARDVLIWGKIPNFLGLAVYFVLASLVCWLGFAWFQKTKKGFADVL